VQELPRRGCLQAPGIFAINFSGPTTSGGIVQKLRILGRVKSIGVVLVCAAIAAPVHAQEAGAPQQAAPAKAQASVRSPLPLATYGDLPGIEDIALSPNGKGLAIVGRLQNERRLMVVEDGKMRAHSPLGDSKVRSVNWVGDDMLILVNSATVDLGFEFAASKHELQGAILFPLDGSPPQQVFDRSPQLVRAIWDNYGYRMIEGKPIGFFGGVELKRSTSRMGYDFDHGRPALFGVDLKRNTPRKVAQAAGEDHWRDWFIDERGQLAATLDLDETSGRWAITNSARTVLANGVDPEGGVSLICLGREGASLIYSLNDKAAESARWYEIPLAGGEAKEVFADLDIVRVYIDPLSGRMLGYLPRDAAAGPVLFDPKQQAVLRKVYRAFPATKLTIQGWTPSFGHVLVSTSGNGDSGTWYVVDMAAMKADPVGYERPSIQPEQVGPISTFAYRAADGLELDGILTLPPGREAKNLPVILLPHGGPQSRDELAFDWWAQAFASRGYAVFQPNFRGSTNRDMAFRRAGYGQWGRKMQTDISDGLAALAKQGIVDPKRACIAGASYGGYAALAGVTLQQGLYRCAVAVAPVSDLTAMYRTEYRESGDSTMVKRTLNESLGDPKTFAEVSPRRNAARADAPILLIHGKDDTVVSFNQSTAMASALKAADKPHEMVVLREEDHWLSRGSTRKQMLEAAMAFVQRHNPAD